MSIVVLLLSSRRYLTAEEIRAAVSGYPDEHEAFKRMFERDKEELRELGIPLETGKNNALDAEPGYRISRQDYQLPEIRLEPDEAAVLGIAARVWQGAELASAAAGALLKLGAAGVQTDQQSRPLVEPRLTSQEPAFGTLWEAVRDRRPVTFSYLAAGHATAVKRELEPWGIVNRRGRWYVAGHDRDRNAVRVFQLGRIVGSVTMSAPAGSVTVPPDADVRELVSAWDVGPPREQEAVLRVRASAGHRLRSSAKDVAPGDDGWDRVTVQLADVTWYADYLASFGPDVMVVEPVDLREAVIRRLKGALQAQSELPSGRTDAGRAASPIPVDTGKQERAIPPPDSGNSGTGDIAHQLAQGFPERVELNVSADMPSQVRVGSLESVACHVSREEIDFAIGRVRDEGRIGVDPARKIILELLPKRNVEVVGERIAAVAVPGERQTSDAYFDIRATHPGMCRVWVVVRQGPVPLATLHLEASAVVEHSANRAVRYPERAQVVVGEATGLDDVTWLKITEEEHGEETFYRFELESRRLGILAPPFWSRRLRHRAEYVAKLYRQIEDRWLNSEGDFRSFQEKLREFGGELLSQLFPEDLQRILWDYRDRLENLIVLSSEPFIPWELVHLKEPRKPLPDKTRFLAELGLVRWLYTSGHAYPPQILRARPGRVRVVCPEYPDPKLRLAHTRGEAQFLTDSLGAIAVIPQEREVRELLRQGGFDVLHFAGHGMADGSNIANAKILLQGRDDNGTYVRSTLSATTVNQQAQLADPDGSKPLIVINACQVGRLGQQMSSLGGFAQAFLDRGAGAFISSMWSVGDEPASTFVTTLYRELVGQQPISVAAAKARQQARSAGDGTWLAYAVYAHPQARLSVTNSELS